MSGRPDAFNPAELLLAAIAACMIKGIERAIPMLKFDLRGVEVSLHGIRQDSPAKMASIDYEIMVDTDEDDRRLDLLHTNVRKYGTIYNTVIGGHVIDRSHDPETDRVSASGQRAQCKVVAIRPPLR